MKDRANTPSKLQYKATSKIVSSKDPEKHGITLNAFDIVSEQEWQAQESIHPYMDCYEILQSKASGFENISIVENLYVGNDESVIEKMIIDAKAKETIVNLKTHLSLDDMLQGNYENTHSYKLLVVGAIPTGSMLGKDLFLVRRLRVYKPQQVIRKNLNPTVMVKVS